MKKIMLFASLFFMTMFFTGAYLPPSNNILGLVRSDSNQNISDNSQEFSVQKNEILNVDLKNGGSIEIEGWSKNIVKVKINSDLHNVSDIVHLSKNSDGVDITSPMISHNSSNNYKLTVKIKVPEKFNVRLKTMGGEISINKVNGNISGKTFGGDLILQKLEGTIELTTMGGDINLTDSNLDGNVNTMGGDVLLENVKGGVKGSSMGGSVTRKNYSQTGGNSIGNEVNISSMGGDLEISDAPNGAKLSTMGGKIEVGSASKYVKAKTMGGDIKLEKVNGWIEATTMGGDINVVMIGDPKQGDRHVKLISMHGDIYLTVPSGLSMNINVKLKFTKNSSRKYKIYSDFKLTQSESNEWDDSNGTPRKTLAGKAEIDGGKNNITIETINGNVYLKKS